VLFVLIPINLTYQKKIPNHASLHVQMRSNTILKLVDEEQQDLEVLETRIVKFFNKEGEKQVEEEYGGTKSVMVQQISLPD
jgi:hypothetical protein